MSLLGNQLTAVIRVEAVMALCSAGLAINTDVGARLWPLFVLPAIASGLTGIDNPARNAIVPRLVGAEHISTAAAMLQVLNQVGVIVGPAMGGLLLAGAGADFVYWFDAASFLVAIAAAWAISPQPKSEGATPPGLRAMVEGVRFIRHRQGDAHPPSGARRHRRGHGLGRRHPRLADERLPAGRGQRHHRPGG